jgi:hypothetical protein
VPLSLTAWSFTPFIAKATAEKGEFCCCFCNERSKACFHLIQFFRSGGRSTRSKKSNQPRRSFFILELKPALFYSFVGFAWLGCGMFHRKEARFETRDMWRGNHPARAAAPHLATLAKTNRYLHRNGSCAPRTGLLLFVDGVIWYAIKYDLEMSRYWLNFALDT